MRLFAAVRPPEPVIEHLSAALDGVRGDAGRLLRWSDPDQLHLTLAFHPDVPLGALDDVIAGMQESAADVDPFGLQLSGAGQFSGRTLWIGVGGDMEPLGSLMRADLLGRPDRERSRAHLTVARVSAQATRGRGGRRRRREPEPADVLLANAVRALSVYRGPMWTVDEIELVSSELGKGRGGGPLHEVEAVIPLGEDRQDASG